MKRILRSSLVVWVVIGVTAFRLGGGVARGEGRVDHGLYAELLQTCVHRGLVDFFMRHAGDLRAALAERRVSIRVRCLDYDWSLNGP